MTHSRDTAKNRAYWLAGNAGCQDGLTQAAETCEMDETRECLPAPSPLGAIACQRECRSCLIAIATIVERGPIGSSCAADVVPMHRMQRSGRVALLLFVPSERPTPGLGDVRFNGGKEECTVGAEHARRGTRMHGTQRPGRMDG